VNGTISAPAITFASESNSGWYRAALNDIRLSDGGVDAITVKRNTITGIELKSPPVTNAAGSTGIKLSAAVSGGAKVLQITNNAGTPYFEVYSTGGVAVNSLTYLLPTSAFEINSSVTAGPIYRFRALSATSGDLVRFETGSSTVKVSFDFNGNATLAGSLNLGLLTAALPTASSAYRGQIRYFAGSSSVADSASVCLKDSAGAYAWHTVSPPRMPRPQPLRCAPWGIVPPRRRKARLRLLASTPRRPTLPLYTLPGMSRLQGSRHSQAR
jgi:hypothetical protein